MKSVHCCIEFRAPEAGNEVGSFYEESRGEKSHTGVLLKSSQHMPRRCPSTSGHSWNHLYPPSLKNIMLMEIQYTSLKLSPPGYLMYCKASGYSRWRGLQGRHQGLQLLGRQSRVPVQVPLHGLEGCIHHLWILPDPFFLLCKSCSGCALAWASTCCRLALDICSYSMIFAKKNFG